jgi:hypothetical protein
MELRIEPWDGAVLFDTAETAALAGWRSTTSAHPRVVAVEPSSEFSNGVRVMVHVDGIPGFHDVAVVDCAQASSGQWFEVGSSGV